MIALPRPSMLDPLTALSIAGNIVQFIDFSIKLVAKGNEVYNSEDGTSIGNAELEVIAKDLQEINCRLQGAPDTGTAEDEALHKLAEQCEAVARELLQALEKLTVQGTANRRWNSVRQALKGLMRRDEVDAIVLRLQRFREELNLHILVSMRYTPHSLVHLHHSNQTHRILIDNGCAAETPSICKQYNRRKASEA